LTEGLDVYLDGRARVYKRELHGPDKIEPAVFEH
jgi:hypothetical protein